MSGGRRGANSVKEFVGVFGMVFAPLREESGRKSGTGEHDGDHGPPRSTMDCPGTLEQGDG